MNRNYKNEQVDGKIEELLKSYQTDFSKNFAEKVMENIQNEGFLKNDVPSINWWRSFSRMVIPAAAVLVVLIGISFSLEKEVSKDALIGTADLTKNSLNPFLLEYWTY